MAAWKASSLRAVFLLQLLFNAGIGFSEINYVQPERVIKCRMEDEICDIKLTISSMLTLTAYSVGENGTRGGTGYALTINEQGGYDFQYPVPEGTTELFQPIIADGTTRRSLLVINDQLPGPTIIGYRNQRVRINVTNNLGNEAITLHWHGMHVNGTDQFMDGVPFITQCPIPPSNSFVYDYHLFPGGTYWYHSHQFDQRSNGMYGGLIVLNPEESSSTQTYIDEPENFTIAFFEWFPVDSNDWFGPISHRDPVNSSLPFKDIPTNDGTEASNVPFYAGLMNSVGWRYTEAETDCRRVANTTLPFFNVSQGSSYRFRIIGSQVTYAYRFSIHNHRLRVVATDGIDATIPSSITDTVDFLILHVGERYDVIVEASGPVENYLMLVETLEVPSILEERGYCIKSHRVYSVLHYDGASDTLPDNFDESYDPLTRCASSQCYAMNCPFQNYPSSYNITCINVAQLELTTPEPVPNNDVNPSAFLNFGFGRGPSINDRVFEFPLSPPLSQKYDIDENRFCQYSTLQSEIGQGVPITGSTSNSSESPLQPPFTCVHTYTVDTDTVEMVFTNLGDSETLLGGSAHPIHLHGHHYRVMNIGYPIYNEDGTVNSSSPDISCTPGGECNVGVSWESGSPPTSACEISGICPMKDTVIVPIGGYVRIRFSRDNWGWWIMHCHIEPHLLNGMAMVVNETSVPGSFPVPQGFPTCGNFNATRSLLPIIPPTTSAPNTPSTGPLITITPEQAKAYRDATIGLAVVAAVLLISFACSVVVIIVLSSAIVKPKKKGSHTVAIELK